ncbi:MAG: hypothetical protein KJ847_03455 [Firmicutes bacterium]|nr:hypothetical protein [Bacillota bacterium]
MSKHIDLDKTSSTNEIAIVMTKKISTKKADQDAIKDLLLLRFGIFGSDNEDTKRYYLEFMTKNGKISFLVDASFYHQIKINSMGMLNHDQKNIYDFKFSKIATSEDITRLNW